ATYAEALELASRIGSRQQECDLWINIGIAYQYSEHFGDAVVCYERVVELAGEEASLQSARKLALSNLATGAWQSGETAKGLASVERAIALDPAPSSASDQMSRVHSEHYYVRLLLAANRSNEARQRVLLARHFAERSRSERAQVLASIAEGLT